MINFSDWREFFIKSFLVENHEPKYRKPSLRLPNFLFLLQQIMLYYNHSIAFAGVGEVLWSSQCWLICAHNLSRRFEFIKPWDTNTALINMTKLTNINNVPLRTSCRIVSLFRFQYWSMLELFSAFRRENPKRFLKKKSFFFMDQPIITGIKNVARENK